jgi:hypothetical protein
VWVGRLAGLGGRERGENIRVILLVDARINWVVGKEARPKWKHRLCWLEDLLGLGWREKEEDGGEMRERTN